MSVEFRLEPNHFMSFAEERNFEGRGGRIEYRPFANTPDDLLPEEKGIIPLSLEERLLQLETQSQETLDVIRFLGIGMNILLKKLKAFTNDSFDQTLIDSTPKEIALELSYQLGRVKSYQWDVKQNLRIGNDYEQALLHLEDLHSEISLLANEGVKS